MLICTGFEAVKVIFKYLDRMMPMDQGIEVVYCPLFGLLSLINFTVTHLKVVNQRKENITLR